MHTRVEFFWFFIYLFIFPVPAQASLLPEQYAPMVTGFAAALAMCRKDANQVSVPFFKKNRFVS
jgi:hypothetical protein